MMPNGGGERLLNTLFQVSSLIRSTWDVLAELRLCLDNLKRVRRKTGTIQCI